MRKTRVFGQLMGVQGMVVGDVTMQPDPDGDGEVLVEVYENVRGRDVFILQSTCAPTNDNLMEILVMTDAQKRSSAAS